MFNKLNNIPIYKVHNILHTLYLFNFLKWKQDGSKTKLRITTSKATKITGTHLQTGTRGIIKLTNHTSLYKYFLKL
jgi:hypothetical protein